MILEMRGPATALSRGDRCRELQDKPIAGISQPQVPAQTDSRRAPLPPSRFLCRKRWHSAPNATPPRAGDGKAGERHPCHCHPRHTGHLKVPGQMSAAPSLPRRKQSRNLGTRDPGKRPRRALGPPCTCFRGKLRASCTRALPVTRFQTLLAPWPLGTAALT